MERTRQRKSGTSSQKLHAISSAPFSFFLSISIFDNSSLIISRQGEGKEGSRGGELEKEQKDEKGRKIRKRRMRRRMRGLRRELGRGRKDAAN